MKPFYLYKITNNFSDKVYIGITSRPAIRKQEHLYGKRSGTVSLIKNAILKHGSENFDFTVLCVGTKDYIVELEAKAIQAYDSIDNGYNIRSGGEGCGVGHKIAYRKDDEPVYAKGFWFPNVRTCKRVMNISDVCFYKWKRNGTLGDVQRLSKDSLDVPTYVAGFWFDSLTRASAKLGVSRKTLYKRLRDGFVEQKQKRKGTVGAENHMTGRTGFLHHNSKAVLIEGVVYGSISEASRLTKYTKKMLYKRLKENVPGFSWYIENTEEILNG